MNSPTHDRPLSLLPLMLHPAWIASLAMLVLNDHVLKGADVLPHAVTGKLSDVAGMFVAPLLLACILRVRSRRAFGGCHLAVGTVFAAINISPACARAFEGLTALTPLPWAIAVDPTDLVVLPLLLASYRLFAPLAHKPRPDGSRALVHGAALVAGVLACMGTSPPPCEGDCVRQIPPTERAVLTLGNTTAQQRLVRVRALAPSMIVDCDVMLEDPSAALHRDMFQPADAWLLEPGRALPIQASRTGCDAVLVDAQGLPMTLIAWDTTRFAETTLPTAVANASTVPNRMLSMVEEDGGLAVAAHETVFDAPSTEAPLPEPVCRVPEATVGIAWSDIPIAGGTITSIATSPDGCHAIDLEGTGSTHLFHVCLPLANLPFSEGELLDIRPSSPQNVTSPIGGATVEGIRLIGETATITAARGAALLPPEGDVGDSYELDVDTQSGCTPHHDECASYVTPLAVTFLGTSGAFTLRAGQSAESDDGNSTLHLVRAQYMPIRNTGCGLQTESAYYFETARVDHVSEPTP